MKTRSLLLWTCVCVAVVAAFAIAADEPAPARPTTERLQRPVPGRAADAVPGGARGPIAAPGERGRGPAGEAGQAQPVNREDALREAMNRRMQEHQQEIAKLQSILKIAETENAAKTVEALKALIAEKDKEVKDQVEQAERRRQEMQQRLEERLGDRAGQRPATAAPAGAGQARPEDAVRAPRQPVQPDQRQRGQQRQQAN